jgi:hypothetical protein
MVVVVSVVTVLLPAQLTAETVVGLDDGLED